MGLGENARDVCTIAGLFGYTFVHFQHWQLPDGAVSVVLCTWEMHVTVPSAAVDYGCSALLLEGRGRSSVQS